MAELTIKKRHAIKKGQLNSLMQKLSESIGDDAKLYTAPMIEIAETAAKFNIYIIDKKPLLMEKDEWAFPTLRGAVMRPFSGRRIIVDMGAVPYMVNGADISRARAWKAREAKVSREFKSHPQRSLFLIDFSLSCCKRFSIHFPHLNYPSRPNSKALWQSLQ